MQSGTRLDLSTTMAAERILISRRYKVLYYPLLWSLVYLVNNICHSVFVSAMNRGVKNTSHTNGKLSLFHAYNLKFSFVSCFVITRVPITLFLPVLITAKKLTLKKIVDSCRQIQSRTRLHMFYKINR